MMQEFSHTLKNMRVKRRKGAIHMNHDGPILMTGINGFCASRLYRYFAEKETVLGFTHNELDITDQDACLRILKEYKPRAVIHSAAISKMDECEKNPELAYRVNVLGPTNLARAAKAIHARLIHFSTDQVYNGSKVLGPHPETCSLAPYNVYGKNKKKAEERIALETDDYAAIRLTWMYDFPVRNIYTSNNLITMCLRALYTNTPLTLSSNSGRGITYVHEVIENIPAMLDAPTGVYNFGSCSNMSTYEAARLIFTLLHAEGRIAELLRPENEEAGKYPDLRMDCGKAAACHMLFSTTEEGIEKAFREYGF
jgi:dTDP-4-dehydrorhamnose reductase